MTDLSTASSTIYFASAGTFAVEVTEHVSLPAPQELEIIIKIIIQIIIGVATIITLLVTHLLHLEKRFS